MSTLFSLDFKKYNAIKSNKQIVSIQLTVTWSSEDAGTKPDFGLMTIKSDIELELESHILVGLFILRLLFFVTFIGLSAEMRVQYDKYIIDTKCTLLHKSATSRHPFQ